MDDRFLYVACWGTGDLQQYDVSDPFNPKLTGKVRIGGIVARAAHPGGQNGQLSGGPQMVEISRDGRRVYFTNSLYGAIDPQFYPDGIDGWMVKLDAKPDGGIAFDPKFFVEVAEGPHRRTRCGSKAATARRIPIAIREARRGCRTERSLAVACAGGLGVFHGVNPGHGLAVRCGARPASQRAGASCWLSLVPIALGHALSVARCSPPCSWRRLSSTARRRASPAASS